MSRKQLLKGTAILTAAGLITRLMGFFYKIYLSRVMGAEILGLYQLIFPVYGICFTLYATGIQTAISKLVAETAHTENRICASQGILKRGMLMSVCIALVLSALLFTFNEFIAVNFFTEPRSAEPLRILSLIFPFCGITACINGFYYGLKRSSVPAATQLVEQLIRIVCVVAAVSLVTDTISCELAVFGLVAGEAASAIFNTIAAFLTVKKHPKLSAPSTLHISRRLLSLAVPLSCNRFLVNILHTFETILLPVMLRRYGLSHETSLSILGIMNGMTMSLLMFPGAVTSSLSVLLLPEISEAYAVRDTAKLKSTIGHGIELSLWLGFMFLGLFAAFGEGLGTLIFHEPLAGIYLVWLSWICPFLYANTTLSSILNGFGKAHLTLLSSISGSVLRIALLVILIPKFGIYGYFISLLVSQLLTTILDTIFTLRVQRFSLHAAECIIKPLLIAVSTAFFTNRLHAFIIKHAQLPALPSLLGMCACYCLIYIAFLFISGACPRSRLRF